MKRLALALAGLALSCTAAQADEAKSAIKPSMVLSLFSQPSELSVRALGREIELIELDRRAGR